MSSNNVRITIGARLADMDAVWNLAYEFNGTEPQDNSGRDATDVAGQLLAAAERSEMALLECSRGAELDALLVKLAGRGIEFSGLQSNERGGWEIDVFSRSSPFGRMSWDCDADGTPMVDVSTLRGWQSEGRVEQMVEAMELARNTPCEAFSFGPAPEATPAPGL